MGWTVAANIHNIRPLRKYLCSLATQPYGKKHINSQACRDCESACAFGRRLLELLEGEAVRDADRKFEIAMECLDADMSMEEAAARAGYKSGHALRVALGRRTKKRVAPASAPDHFPDTTKTMPDADPPRSELERPYVYAAQYKCRLCGEVSHDCCWGNQKLAFAHTLHVAITGNPFPMQPMAPSLMTIHHCPDGSIGVADYIGAARVPAE